MFYMYYQINPHNTTIWSYHYPDFRDVETEA